MSELTRPILKFQAGYFSKINRVSGEDDVASRESRGRDSQIHRADSSRCRRRSSKPERRRGQKVAIASDQTFPLDDQIARTHEPDPHAPAPAANSHSIPSFVHGTIRSPQRNCAGNASQCAFAIADIQRKTIAARRQCGRIQYEHGRHSSSDGSCARRNSAPSRIASRNAGSSLNEPVIFWIQLPSWRLQAISIRSTSI